MLIQLLALPALAWAFIPEHFGFEWQERLGLLNLEDNNATASGCEAACKWIEQTLPIPEYLPSSKDYWKEKAFFWSQQQEVVSPKCFVQPTGAEDVAAIVVLAKKAECGFAVKAGGHAAFAGGSNIQDGITIDLQLLNQIEVSEDKTTTRIGPGNRWVDVYSTLYPQSLGVVGGRVSEIGVGGLTLGGGISFFSGRFGWALDGIRNYELVSANGEVLQVNHESHPDLYWALRGGGNNFGIVTAFDMETFPQADMWGGAVVSMIEYNQTALDAFVNYAHNSPQDVDAQAFVAFAYYQAKSMHIISTELTYTQPIPFPTLLENFTAIPNISSTVKITKLPDLTQEIQGSNPNGKRQSFWTATFKADRQMAGIIADIYFEEVEKIQEVEGIIPALVYQAISTAIAARFARNGGNCLGIKEEEAPLMVINFAVMWDKIEDDELVMGVCKSIIDRSVERSKELGLDHRYLYQNYAAEEQDVFGGYGEENRKKLREVSLKYDPEQVFQKLQPGYFKL